MLLFCPKIPPFFLEQIWDPIFSSLRGGKDWIISCAHVFVVCVYRRLINSPLVKADCCTPPQKCIKMDTRSTLPCSGLNKCTSLTTLMIKYDHLELLKGNIPSSFQTPVTDLLGLICNFDHDNQKFTPGAWQMRIERTKSVFKYIWWIMNVHRDMCVASFDPFSAHMQTWIYSWDAQIERVQF